MAKAKEQHQKRLDDLSLLGKDLARRSGRACELCGTAGVSLQTIEVDPVPLEPDLGHCLFICSVCAEQMVRKQRESSYWHCLSASIWSEVAPVQVTAWRLLQQIKQERWAEELLETVYLHEDAQQWLWKTGEILPD